MGTPITPNIFILGGPPGGPAEKKEKPISLHPLVAGMTIVKSGLELLLTTSVVGNTIAPQLFWTTLYVGAAWKAFSVADSIISSIPETMNKLSQGSVYLIVGATALAGGAAFVHGARSLKQDFSPIMSATKKKISEMWNRKSKAPQHAQGQFPGGRLVFEMPPN